MTQAINRDAKGVLRLTGSEPTRVPTGKIHEHGKINRWSSAAHGAMNPEKLFGIRKQLERGETWPWIDLAKYIVNTDGRIRGLVQTRINAVASSEVVFKSGHAKPGEEALADEVAQFVREEWQCIADSARLVSRMLYAIPDGWSAHENIWEWESGIWHSHPKWLHPRDVSFSADWNVRIRDTMGGDWPTSDRWWLVDEHPGKFIVHIPGQSADWPQMSGELLPISWDWLFARWIIKFRQNGLERFANPTPIGMVPAEAPDGVVDEVLEQLEQLSATHAGVVRGATSIELIEAAGTAGEAWTKALDHFYVNMAVSYLGSDLNTAAGNVGAYALGASQFSTTMLPRFRLDAKLCGATLIRDWAAYAVKFNSHLFGGRKDVPLPIMDWEIAQDSAKPPMLSVQVSGATIDEVRAGDGLPARGPELGGDKIAVLPQRQPQFGQQLELTDADVGSPGGAVDKRPFGHSQPQVAPITGTPNENDLVIFARKLSAKSADHLH